MYRGIIATSLDEGCLAHINTISGHFTDAKLAGTPVRVHVARFLSLFSRLLAYLDGRNTTGMDDLTASIDLLDYFASTSRWWSLDRRQPFFVLRPPTRSPRESLDSLAAVTIDGPTMSRLGGAVDRLARFLDEHEVNDRAACDGMCESLVSIWTILCSLLSFLRGRSSTTENDFERAYDVTRVLLFHVDPDEFRALVAVRRVGTHPILLKAADVILAPDFESQLDSSMAAHLERSHAVHISPVVPTRPRIVREVLTGSLRILAQCHAAASAMEQLGASDYERVTHRGLALLGAVGVPLDFLQDPQAVTQALKRLHNTSGLADYLEPLMRRLELLIVDASGNRDFHLEHTLFVTRLMSLLLLLAIATGPAASGRISPSDLRRGLILLSRLLGSLLSH